MKKRLFLLPLLGGFLLTGCQIQIGNKVIKFFEKDEPKQEEKKDDEKPSEGGEQGGEEQGGEETPTTVAPVIKEEFGDYKLAKSVVEGGKYVIGVYRSKFDYMRFFNGDYHRDAKGYYPFYMGCGAEDDVSCAAEVTAHFVSENEFTLQVSTSDTSLPWNGKYIGVYSATSGYNNQVMSIAVMDSPDQTSYTDPKSGKVTDVPSAIFKYHTTCNEQTVYAPAVDYKYEGLDEEKVPKFLGTAADYVSIDCKSYEVATDGNEYDLAHLYEHK